eukprot:3575671-Amphidinium_carterae.1
MSRGNVRNAFLDAEMDKDAPKALVKPPTEVIKMGLVKPDTMWICEKACYGLKESPKMWEER